MAKQTLDDIPFDYFTVDNPSVQRVNFNPLDCPVLPAHPYLEIYHGVKQPTPEWITHTFLNAFKQSGLSIPFSPRALSLGTGNQAYEEFNSLLYLTNGRVQEYLAVDNNPKSLVKNRIKLERVSHANATLGDVRSLDNHVSGLWDVTIIRNPQVYGKARAADMQTWGMATAQLKPFLKESSLLLATTMSAVEAVAMYQILLANGYSQVKIGQNANPGPTIGLDLISKEEIKIDKHLLTARR